MSLGAGNLLLASAGDAGYNLTRSLRFRRSAGGYLSRTAGAGNQQIMTLSFWFKRGVLGVAQYIFGSYSSGSAFSNLYIESTDQIGFADAASATNLLSTQVFRDPSAWYHIVVAIDTTQATAANRVKFYVNNVQITAFASSTYPAQNTNLNLNSAVNHTLFNNAAPAATNYTDGYLAETNFVNALQLTPSSFGSTNTTTGVWQPARYTGTYGANGFYLPFTDNSALTTSSNVGLGKDFSGNGNYWTTNNISITAGVTYDSMLDVPTLTSATAANFAVLNPLNPSRSTLTNGNLTASGTTDTPTIIPTSGTWYFEIDGVSKTWTLPAAFPAAAGNYNFGQRPFTNTPTGTLLNCYNLPDSTIKNGSDNMNIALAAGASIKANTEALFTGQFLEWIKDRANANNHQLLNGVTGLSAVLQSNTTAAETTYSAPSGNSVGFAWKAGSSSSSNTNGTITSTVSVNASAGFSVVTYTGTGVNATVGHGLGVVPSLVIVKQRGGATNWTVWHSNLTSAAYYLSLNTTEAQANNTGVWNNTAPSSSVFTVGNYGVNNASGSTYVAYCWTPIAGYSAFGSYTGNGSTDGTFVYTGFKPKFVMMKRTDGVGNWWIFDTARDTYNVMTQGLYADTSAVEANNGATVDYLSNGFKLRLATYQPNTNGGTFIYMAFAETPFKNSLAR
jgi:hypothetical protein